MKKFIKYFILSIILIFLIILVMPNSDLKEGFPNKESSLKSRMYDLQLLLENYYLDNNKYPENTSILLKEAKLKNYFRSSLNQYTNKEIQYINLKKIVSKEDEYFTQYVGKGNVAYFCCYLNKKNQKIYEIYAADGNNKILKVENRIYLLTNK